MMAAVATGGRLVTPRLWKSEPTEESQLKISKRTFDIVQRALTLAVEDGTARRATRGEFTVAGKTGTSQVYKHSAGIDADDLPKDERDHAWFVGYSPTEDPRIAFAIVVEHGGHGGTSAAPIARKVLEVYYGDPPVEKRRANGLRAAAMNSIEAENVRTPATR
jgi:penicillin-binding protein 2